MTISFPHLSSVIHLLEDGIRDEKQWLGVDSRIQQLSSADLHFFDTEEKAIDFQEFNSQHNKEVLLLPVDQTHEYIHNGLVAALGRGEQSPAITIDKDVILAMHENVKLNTTIAGLETLMDSFNWSQVFYDPLEANTQAEHFEDKVQYNRLEILVEELSAFASSGQKAKAAVEELVLHYWAGEAMEVQIEPVLNGTIQSRRSNDNLLGERGHPVSSEVLDKARIALANGRQFMAYNKNLYLIGKEDVQFFSSREKADQFAADNNSDQNSFNVIRIISPEDILRQIPYGNFQTILSPNNDFMIMENVKYLKDNIKYTGFGEALYPELEKNIQAKKEEFQLHFTTQVNNRPFDAVLHFRKSSSSDMYFFNRYDASIERNKGEKLEQSFAINKGKGVTAKEAYNLLQGRAVKKELTNAKGETYQAWMQLDFENKDDKGNYLVKKYNDNYGYDLRDAVAKFPVKELDGGEKEKELLRSLEKGNAQVASIDVNGEQKKIFLEANPQYKTVNVYDEHFKMLKHEELPIVQKPVSQTQELSEKQDTMQEVKQGKKQSEKKGQTQKNDNGLLGKKRVRKRKGVKIG